MKKLLALLLFLCLLLGCAWAEEEVEEIQYYVDFDAYDFTGERMMTVDVLDWDGSQVTEQYSGLGIIVNPGQTIGEAMTELGYLSLTMEVEGFEGWMTFENVVTVDEDGFENSEYVKLPEAPLYTTEEVLGMTAPEFNVIFVAKWADIPVEDYFTPVEMGMEDVSVSGSFSIWADGGMMTFAPSGDTSGYYTYWMEEGQTLDDLMGEDSFWEKVNVVEKDGAAFSGWTIYKADDILWSSEPEEDCLSILCSSYGGENTYLSMKDSVIFVEDAATEELYAIVSDGTNYLAIANWE